MTIEGINASVRAAIERKNNPHNKQNKSPCDLIPSLENQSRKGVSRLSEVVANKVELAARQTVRSVAYASAMLSVVNSRKFPASVLSSSASPKPDRRVQDEYQKDNGQLERAFASAMYNVMENANGEQPSISTPVPGLPPPPSPYGHNPFSRNMENIAI